MHRFEEGNQVKRDLSRLVIQYDGLYLTLIDRRDVNAARLHQLIAKSDALGGIVVAADKKNVQLALGQLYQKVIEQADCFLRRNGTVVHIPGDHNRLRRIGIDDGQNL